MVCVYRQVGFISSDNSLGKQLTELCDRVCCYCGARKKYNWAFDILFLIKVLSILVCWIFKKVSAVAICGG